MLQSSLSLHRSIGGVLSQRLSYSQIHRLVSEDSEFRVITLSASNWWLEPQLLFPMPFRIALIYWLWSLMAVMFDRTFHTMSGQVISRAVPLWRSFMSTVLLCVNQFGWYKYKYILLNNGNNFGIYEINCKCCKCYEIIYLQIWSNCNW